MRNTCSEQERITLPYLGNVSKLVGLQAMDGLVLLGKQPFETFHELLSQHTESLSEKQYARFKKLAVHQSFFSRSTGIVRLFLNCILKARAKLQGTQSIQQQSGVPHI